MMHEPTHYVGYPSWCFECGNVWPCPTSRSWQFGPNFPRAATKQELMMIAYGATGHGHSFWAGGSEPEYRNIKGHTFVRVLTAVGGAWKHTDGCESVDLSDPNRTRWQGDPYIYDNVEYMPPQYAAEESPRRGRETLGERNMRIQRDAAQRRLRFARELARDETRLRMKAERKAKEYKDELFRISRGWMSWQKLADEFDLMKEDRDHFEGKFKLERQRCNEKDETIARYARGATPGELDAMEERLRERDARIAELEARLRDTDKRCTFNAELADQREREFRGEREKRRIAQTGWKTEREMRSRANSELKRTRDQLHLVDTPTREKLRLCGAALRDEVARSTRLKEYLKQVRGASMVALAGEDEDG